MKRHVLLGVFRVVLAAGVIIALPVSHMKWGASFAGDGQQASGFIASFAVIGFVAAVPFVALGSLAQFLFRRRSPRITVFIDLGLFLAFAVVLVYGGATAKYNDTPPKTMRSCEPGHRARLPVAIVAARGPGRSFGVGERQEDLLHEKKRTRNRDRR